MNRSSPSVVEEFAGGLYLIVLCGSVAGVGWVQQTSGFYIGGAFVVIALLWLTVLTAVWAAFVVLSINAYRYVRDEPPMWHAATFAIVSLLAIAATIFLAFATTYFHLWIVTGVIGFLCTLGLVATVLERRGRRVWGQVVQRQ